MRSNAIPLKSHALNLRTDAYDRQQATGGGAFFAVGEEKIWAAGGTEVADVDVLGAEASG